MKIVAANNYYYLKGGSERVMFDETAALVASGHEVIPFSQYFLQNTRSSPYDSYFLPGVNYENVTGFSKIKTAINIIYSRRQGATFSRLLHNENPTLIHGHNIYGGLTFSIVDAAKRNRIPFVVTLHDFKLVCPSYLMLNNGNVCDRCVGGRFWNCIINRCHKDSLAASIVYSIEALFNSLFGKYDWISSFICPSRFLLEKHLAGGFPQEKLQYLPNALDPTHYDPARGSGKYVLFVGRLSKEKGLLTLLAAFRNLKIPLRIAGTGPVDTEARLYVENHSMNHVTFEGYCSGDKLKNLYRGAAFLVIPSEWYENAPMSILEAFAYGKPVIGSSIGGIPELIVPDATGFLHEPGNIYEIQYLVEMLWRDKRKIDEMGRMARLRIENEFSLSTHLEKLMSIYLSAVNKV